MRVSIREAARRLEELVRSVRAGKDVSIAESGQPLARLTSAREATAKESGVGQASTILDWLAKHPLPAESRRSAEEIDAGIAAERNAWE
jgi:prevent-host-death family protein